MSTGQTRVLVLLGVLFALELVVHPGINAWTHNIFGQFSGALSNNFNSNTNAPNPTGLPTANIPRPIGGNCPPGYSFNPGTGRCQKS